MLHVSKWLKLPLLVDLEEMEDLFNFLPSFLLYQVQSVTAQGEGVLQPAEFLSIYATYIETLKKGAIPKPLPSPVLSVTPDALYAMPLEGGRQLYKPQLPVVQMQPHAVRYSEADGSFRSQLFGTDGISWGMQLGYPQIYEDPKTYEILSTRDLPNGPLFRAIQKWVRRQTRPTPFVAEGKKQNVPIRLGATCFSWINTHPQLKAKGLEIEYRADPSPSHKE